MGEAGNKYVGGTLEGLTSKIGYLKRLELPPSGSVGAGNRYISRNLSRLRHPGLFLKVNHRFGTHQQLKQLVKTAHDNGIFVIMDIILNHVGNVLVMILHASQLQGQEQ